MRTRLLLLVAVVVAALGTTAGSAHAVALAPGCFGQSDSPYYSCNTSISTLSYYKGWASVRSVCNGAASNDYAAYGAAIHAWSWTAAGWRASSFKQGTHVYVWPYATGWSWVWTQQTGWLAMRDQDLVINLVCYVPAAPAAGRWGG